jgi:hypothetical protein
MVILSDFDEGDESTKSFFDCLQRLPVNLSHCIHGSQFSDNSRSIQEELKEYSHIHVRGKHYSIIYFNHYLVFKILILCWRRSRRQTPEGVSSYSALCIGEHGPWHKVGRSVMAQRVVFFAAET